MNSWFLRLLKIIFYNLIVKPIRFMYNKEDDGYVE